MESTSLNFPHTFPQQNQQIDDIPHCLSHIPPHVTQHNFDQIQTNLEQESALHLSPKDVDDDNEQVLTAITNYSFSSSKLQHIRVRVLNTLACIFTILTLILRNSVYHPTLELASSYSLSSSSSACATSFFDLTDVDATFVGSSFNFFTLSHSSPSNAVIEYIKQFKCLTELDELCPAFRPLLNLVATAVFKTSSFGSSFRLYLGAFLSMFDMITDLLMVRNYIESRNIGFAKALVSMLSLNMVVQLILVWVQNRRLGFTKFFFELLLTLFCVSPGVHAYRVANGEEHVVGEVLNPRTMMMHSKCIVRVRLFK